MTPVLADTSVCIDHFRQGNAALAQLLAQDRVLGHPLVLGKVACSTPPDRTHTLRLLGDLQSSYQASVPEALDFIERERLFGLGWGLVDVMLLASALLTPGARLWTLDRRLAALAQRLGAHHAPTRA